METMLRFTLLCCVIFGDQVLAYPRLSLRQISGKDLNQGLLVHRLRRETPGDVSGSPSEGVGQSEHTVLQEHHQTDQGANTDMLADLQPTDPAIDQPADTPAEPRSQDAPVETQPETQANNPADPPADPPTEPIVPNTNPLLMSRPGEPMPVALSMRGNRATHQEHTSATSERSGSGSSDPQAKQEHQAQPPAETEPVTGSSLGVGLQQVGGAGAGFAPRALPQTGEAPPSGEPSMRGRQFWGQRPVAMAQNNAPPKNSRPAPPMAGNQGVKEVNPARNQRPPPKWTGRGGPGPATQAPGSGADPSRPGGQGPPSPGGTQWPNPYYDPYYSYMYGMPPPPPGGTGQPTYRYPPYRMPEMPDMPDFPRLPGYNLNFQALPEGYPGRFPGFPPCTNMSDPRCIQQSMMEMDIESPYGEMDMEYGELDIEGPMAFQMLRNMGMHNITDSHFPEITLNMHVLQAMQKRFGVNTTAGIQRMSSNPEFQAFMYQVLRHSTPLSLAEFNANLTRAEVDRIMANLDAGPPNHRLAAVNLNHAHLSGAETPKDGASLTLDNNPMSNLFPNMPPNPYLGNPMMGNPMMGNPFMGNPFMGLPPPEAPPTGNTPSKTSPLVQKPAPTETAQAGTFQALVGHRHGEMGEGRGRAGEAGEREERGNQTALNGRGRGMQRPHTDKLHTTRAPMVASMTDSVAGGANTSAMALGVKASAHSQTANHAAGSLPESNQVVKDHGHGPSQLGGPQANTQPQHNHGASQPGEVHAKTQPQPQPLANNPAQPQPGITKEQDIVGKDSNKGVSKDQQTRTQNAGNKNPAAAAASGQLVDTAKANTNVGGKTQVQPAGTSVVNNPSAPNPSQTNAGVGSIPGQPNTGVKANPGQQTNQGVKTNSNSIPIGIQEAGLAPEIMNKTVPVKADTGYSTTGFAIAAATIIALVVILGPLACMLCKMREKRAEKLRKQKAHKNRDMSENSIMESMVLHDFGKSSLNSVTNSAAERSDYFSYGKGRFSTINSDMVEMERLSGNPESPRGRLP